MNIEAQVGPRQVSDGSENKVRSGRTGEVVVGDAHARYYEPTVRKTMYSGSIVGQVTTVGLATTYTGLCLSNPVGSSVNLVVNKAGYSFIVAFTAGAHIGLMTGFNAATNVTHTTPVVTRSQFFAGSSGSGVGLLDSAATLPTAPTVNLILGSGLTGAITTATNVPSVFDLEGSLVIPPGGYVAFYTSTASGAAAGAFSFSWEEIAI